MSVRFAPSPTGTFHVGNFRTAWIAHRWARRLGLPWVVRFEDIDKPRVVPGAMEKQLEDMASLGLVADRVEIQSARAARHWEVFERALAARQIYPCFCSRKAVRDALDAAASAPHAPPGDAQDALTTPAVYDGRCRDLSAPPAHSLPTIAWRFRSPDAPDGTRDFIVARTSPELDAQGRPAKPDSFIPAYNWACAIDDYDGRHTLLVRAHDLAGVLGQQRAIQHWLAREEGTAFAFPAVYHCALVVADDGSRLEKRTKGVTLAELATRGFSHDRILSLFEASFEPPHLGFEPGAVFGEARTQLTLSELGFGSQS